MKVSILPWLVLIAAVLAAGLSADAAEVSELIPYTDLWRYEASGANLEPGWQSSSFDDANWETGPGVLGFPMSENLLGTATLGTEFADNRSIITYYFRHVFEFVGSTHGVVLVASNLLDDGAVFYLNGSEIGRIAMPQGPVTADTFAVRASDVSSHGIDVLRLALPPLVEGTNVMAVELHQGGPSSPDAIFGMNLWAELPEPGPARISMQPVGRTVVVGDSVTFSVNVQGTPPFIFQWSKDGEPIPGATNQGYTVESPGYVDAGDYRVGVTNLLGQELSAAARLTVRKLPVLLLPFAHSWRYDNSATDLGTAWREPGYDDSMWSEGAGPLGRETAVLPVPLRTTFSLAANPVTCYFRTHFVVAEDPIELRFVATNLIDDGVVLYLNGVELDRLGMSPGPVIYSSVANRSVGDATIERVILPATGLVRGTNLLAAEVHQLNSVSSDLVFGLSLLGDFIPPTQLSIAREPLDLVVNELQSALFQVEVTGEVPRFQWFGQGAPIAGATGAILTLTNVQATDAGDYQVRVSNEVSTVYSRLAQLVVRQDTTPPGLVDVDGRSGLEEIRAVFSEPVDPMTATNSSHYHLSTAAGEPIPILSAEWIGPREVRLRTGPRDPQLNHVLTATGVADLSPAANYQVSAAPVAFAVPLVAWDDHWTFYDPLPGLDLLDPGVGWREMVFDDSAWGRGRGGFAYGERPADVKFHTALTGGPVTSFFRCQWEMSASRVGAVLSLRYLVDDGAVFYLNGNEMLRLNLPDGPVGPATRALQSVGLAEPSGPLLLESNLPPGTNLFAVELHRDGASDEDAVFAVELEAKALSWAHGPIVFTRQPIDQTVQENRPLKLGFVATGGKSFQWHVDGIPISAAIEPELNVAQVPLSWDGANLQVVVSNDTFSQTSAVSRVTVLADIAPPVFLSAAAERATIVLTFDEPLDPLSVDAAIYRVSNGSAPPRRVLSASLIGATQILLTLDGSPHPGDEVRLSNLRDAAEAGNAIVAGSGRTVSFTGALIPIDGDWKYNQEGIGLGTAWREPAYDDTAWPSGPALLGTESAVLAEPLRTRILTPAEGGPITVYFRKLFYLPSVQARLRLEHIIDDGMVLYLNGSEVYRVGISGAPLVFTFASRTVDDAFYEGPFLLPIGSLRLGENVLAAELHQFNETSTDAVFGLTLTTDPVMSLPLDPQAALRLRLESGQIVIEWEPADYQLQEGPTPAGPWTSVAGAATPHLVQLEAMQRFYRLSSGP